MNLRMIEENYIGASMTVVTTSGNKIQGEVVRTDGDGDILKLKTENGLIMINASAVESIY
jgi:hypothetical protein